jgi:uncharacterized membrane protein YkoI
VTDRIKKVLMGVAALAALALGGAAIAGAVSGNDATTTEQAQQQTRQSGTDADQTRDKGQRSDETPLTGETATKVEEAALAEVGGGTVERVETDANGNAAYEAHIVADDGTRVTVYIDEQFNVVGTEEGGPGGRRGDETALTGDTAAKVEEAALAEVGGGTVERVETDADGNAAYEAHIVADDGTRVTVYVDEQFNVVGVDEHDDSGQQDGDGRGTSA